MCPCQVVQKTTQISVVCCVWRDKGRREEEVPPRMPRRCDFLRGGNWLTPQFPILHAEVQGEPGGECSSFWYSM